MAITREVVQSEFNRLLGRTASEAEVQQRLGQGLRDAGTLAQEIMKADEYIKRQAKPPTPAQGMAAATTVAPTPAVPQFSSNTTGGFSYNVTPDYMNQQQAEMSRIQKINEDNALRVQQAILAQQKASQTAQAIPTKYGIDALRQQQLTANQNAAQLANQQRQTLLGVQDNPNLTMSQIVGQQGQVRQVLGAQLEGAADMANVAQQDYQNALSAADMERKSLMDAAAAELNAASQLYGLSQDQYNMVAKQLQTELDRQYNTRLNELRLQQEQAQLEQYQQKATGTATSSELEKLLTPTEAARLGVPYGTTRGQAAQAQVTPSFGRTTSGTSSSKSTAKVKVSDLYAGIDEAISGPYVPDYVRKTLSAQLKQALYEAYPYLSRAEIDKAIGLRIDEKYGKASTSSRER